MIYFFVHMKMSYYLFNRQELLQKSKDRYLVCGGQENAVEYYIVNKEVWKENANKYWNLSEEEKEGKREYDWNRYRNMAEDKKKQAKSVLKKLSSRKK